MSLTSLLKSQPSAHNITAMMKTLAFQTLDVFTDTLHQGNPLAICLVPEDEDIPTTTLQRIAREFNLSETVFLYGPHETKQDWRMRIFTTNMELTFAGHPTIGTAIHVLQTYDLGVATLTCPAGKILITKIGALASAIVPHAYHRHAMKTDVQDMIKLQPALRDHSSSVLKTDLISPVRGMNFLVTELASLEALAAISTTGTKPPVIVDDQWDGFIGTGYYVFMGEHDGQQRYRTRMIETTLEDPATGSYSCALASLLALKLGKSAQFEFIQGVEMGRESHIGVEVVVRDGKVSTVSLLGTAVSVMEGQVKY